jgi:hypothetical protein
MVQFYECMDIRQIKKECTNWNLHLCEFKKEEANFIILEELI